MNPPKKSTAGGGAHVDPRIAQLEKEIVELTHQVKTLTDLAARAQADLQNAKIRMGKDREELGAFASENIIRRILPVIDNFQRAFQHLPEDLKNHEWVKGVFAIEQELLKHMTEMGLKKIEALGKTVDASRHEVLMTGPGEEGKVIEIFEDGYELYGKVLRPAKVKVGETR